jgi:ABC-2 type transport system permease protein
VKGMLKAEWLKLLTTRAFLGLIAGAVGVAGLGAFSTVASTGVDSLSGPLHEQTFWVLSSINIGLFALIVGIRAYTEEYRHRTIVHTLFADPHRRRSAVAKALVSALAAVILTAVAMTVTIGIVLAMASVKGGNLAPDASDAGAIVGLLGASALWAVLGVGIGALVRHQVAAIVGGLVWVLVIENMGAGFLGQAGSYLPGQTAHSLARATEIGDLVAVPMAADVLGGYALLSWAAGVAATRRRDVA